MTLPWQGPARRRSVRSIAAAALVAAAIVLAAFAPPAAATQLPPGFSETAVSTGFNAPVAVDWAPDGRMFVAEKSGRVRVVNPDGTLQSTPLLDIRHRVNSFSDRGMLGLAVDANFESNGYLYLLYVYELNTGTPDSDAPMVSRLTRVTVNPDNTLQNPADPETVILGSDVSGPCPTPDNNRDCIPADYKWHVIGTVRSDPTDGTLWVGTGDTHPHAVDANSYRPYDTNSFAGKIIHIDRQGRGLADHPFCSGDANLDHTCTKIYARGFRNPYRFTLRPGKGPVVGDVGANDQEEIDLIEPGQNYGWPCYEGSIRTPLYDEELRCLEEYAKEGTPDAATPPSWSYPQGDGGAVIAGPTYTGDAYPEDYRGDVFVGDYVQGWVKRLEVNAQDEVTAVRDFASDWITGVSLEQGPDGKLWAVDIGFKGGQSALRRYDFSGTNAPPTATATASPSSGDPPLQVRFTGSGSTDPENDALTYDWDFGDGSQRSAEADPVHTYSSAGVYTATLSVDDGNGNTATDTVRISVGGDAPPTASIDAPADESSYRAGEPVQLRGSGTDPEDGALGDAGLSWQVLLHHGTHIHEVGTFQGAQASFTPFTDHGADSFYEVRLTAADSAGQTSTRTIEVRPEISRLTLASSPLGAGVSFDDRAQNAPYTVDAAVGSKTAVSAPETFTYRGRTYRFERWSDGGARQHEITASSQDKTLTAHYRRDDADQTLTFTPEADAYVDELAPTTSNGSSSGLVVETNPTRQSFLRFPVSGVGDREVLGVRLRMYQADKSPAGGRVFAMSSNSWPESTTYSTRPAIDGPLLDSFGQVSTGLWYEADLGRNAVTRDGDVSFALDSPNEDKSRWASSETATKPELIVELGPPGSANSPPTAQAAATPTSGDAPLAVQFSSSGSSDPDGDALTYEWDFGDGSARSSATSPTHTYTAPGNYQARLTVDDGRGNTDARTVAITVRDPGGTETLTFTPEADTYVDSSTPNAGKGGSSGFEVESSPVKQAFLRFPVTGIGGRDVVGVRLRLQNVNGSPQGGRVFAMSSNAWPESTTYANRPAIDGVQLASFGRVVAGSAYTADLGPNAVTDDGKVSFGLDSTNTDKARWASRETASKPQLIVEVAPGGGGNSPPAAQASAEPTTGPAPLAVQFAGSDSSDPDGDALAYDWDFGDGTPHSAQANPSHTYDSPGTYQARLTVSDGNGGTDSKTVAIQVTGPTETLTFTPAADTYVDSSAPSAVKGASLGLEVESSPHKQSFLRFPVSGVAGREVVGVRLRMYNVNASAQGGRVHAMSSNSWTESATYSSRPAIDGPQLAAFGIVKVGNWYSVDLGAGALTGDGPFSFGLDSNNTDGARWSSRESANKPQLLVEVRAP